MLTQSERMVNNQTSQYKLLDFIFYLSGLGVFQCVRDILQVTFLIDHPVSGGFYNFKCLEASNIIICQKSAEIYLHGN